jgi:hypothetical protein
VSLGVKGEEMAGSKKSRIVGGMVAVLAAGLMAAMVWAPWVKTPNESVTGWDIHEQASGSQQWFIGDFVAERSPFFPALPILVVAGVMGLLGLGLAMKRDAVSKRMQMVALVIGFLGMFIAFANPIMISTTGPGADIVTFDWGLLVIAAAAFVAFGGVLFAMGPRGRKPAE